MRRGFKTEANDIARTIRNELSLRCVDPLDPRALAEYLSIRLIPLSDLADAEPWAVRHFGGRGRSSFSAATVFRGSRRVIVHNDAHSPGRQASNLAHELSHALLLHPPTPRNWDNTVEEEADWLAGALLVSQEAALSIARKGIPLGKAAALYGISRKMMQFRVNVTGARKRVRRMRAHRIR